MAVGWKSLAGIVGAASVVSVGTLYSVLVREPISAPPPPQTNAAPANQQPTPQVTGNPTAGNAQPGAQTPASQDQSATKSGTSTTGAAKPDGAKPQPDVAAAAPGQPKPIGSKPDAPLANPAQATSNPGTSPSDPVAQGAPALAAKGEILPTFDIARIEPGGDAVIAGRAAPGATVELLRNGNSYARAVADVGGQWAIVPPPLPKGPCELTLRTTSPDGRVAQSQQTVSVRVPEQPDEEVVIVLNAPDQPSKVLTDAARPSSKPVANSQVAAAPPTRAVPSGDGTTVTNPSAPTPSTPRADASTAAAARTPSRANASIRTVEADESGRFFVTGMAEPGSTLRIYLNDTLVTTVTAAKDGTFGMTIEKGMSPGDYRVRVDDVAAGTGQVLTRAEVPFAMAEKSPMPSTPAVVAAATSPSKPAGSRATPPASTSGAATTSAGPTPGAVTPQQTLPASVQAPGAASSSAVPVAAATDGGASGGKTEPAATAAPAQGASPAATQTNTATAGSAAIEPAQPQSSASATTPIDKGTATQPTPGTQPVQVGDAKPAAAAPPPSVAVIPEIRTTTIVQGDNLWRISRKIYGQGIRYTWIYDANTDQIRNPNLIYPGQIFVMPDNKQP